jgi:hypothetical protein
MHRTFTKNGKKLIYVPVDIKVDLPDPLELTDFHNKYHILDKNYDDYKLGRHEYCLAGSRYSLDEPRKFPHVLFDDKDEWKNLHTDYELKWIPEFTERFPTLVEMVNQLPFKQIALVGWMRQFGPYGAHFDSSDPSFPMEPRRYNALLTDPAHNTFWMGNEEGPKYHATVDPKYPCFAFNNTDIKHGTDMVTGLKIVLGVMGVIDKEKHEELIARSVEKFSERAIWI